LKSKLFIPPVAALIIASIWLGNQRRSISSLENESALLQKSIATAKTSAAATDSAEDSINSHSSKSRSLAKAKAGAKKDAIDWKEVAASFQEMRASGGMGDVRGMIRLHSQFSTMSEQELVAALDEIAALEIEDSVRSLIESMVAEQLAEKNPELALSRFTDRLSDGDQQGGWMLSQALGKWAEKDATKAAAWLDQQIAAGKLDSKSLDGKNRTRAMLESGLIQKLLSSDPAAAAARVAVLPEDQRSESIQMFSSNPLNEKDQLVFAKLVREQIPDKEQSKILGRQGASLARQGDYQKVTAYLNHIQASQPEKAACVEEVATSRIQSIAWEKKLVREDFDKMREWAKTQAPEAVNAVTGKALGDSLRSGNSKFSFPEAIELTTQYHDAGGGDDLLAGFLESWPARSDKNKEQSRILATKIIDQKRRDEILKRLK
jgi:hypothetical protein